MEQYGFTIFCLFLVKMCSKNPFGINKNEQWKRKMLTRKQFDVLVALKEKKTSQRELEEKTGYSLGSINKAVKELTALGYIDGGAITENGVNALEPYRAKRAVFIAAGFGSRLVPVTLNTPKPLVRVFGVRIIDRLIEACLKADINEIYIVRGYLAEQFDQLLNKYPMIKFIENPAYNEANNISSALKAKDLLSNAYVFEADLVLYNPDIITKYHYRSDFLAIKKDRTDDWCFEVKDGIIVEQKVGGLDCWQMVGISYWNTEDGKKLVSDLVEVFNMPGGKEKYWEQVPLAVCKNKYQVEVKPCLDSDIVEIDTFRELKAIDKTYDV